jgi:hypothetical protein
MTAGKALLDFSGYVGVLPYASELTGTFQPMIGWKGKRSARRFDVALSRDARKLLERFAQNFAPGVTMPDVAPPGQPADPIGLDVGAMPTRKRVQNDSRLLAAIAPRLPAIPPTESQKPWSKFINSGSVSKALEEVERQFETMLARGKNNPALQAQVRRLAEDESRLAAALLTLAQAEEAKVLDRLFYFQDVRTAIEDGLSALREGSDRIVPGLGSADRDRLSGGVISPLGIIHLYRQYFFELDTFLGSPVQHVWLAPGATVELYEIHTRREITDRTIAQLTESIRTSEQTVTVHDELSESTKEDSSNDLSLGASVTASYPKVTATGTFAMARTQQQSRDVMHKQMREQSTKIATSIRNNFQSTFRSSTEYTDTSSIRHVFSNPSNDLQNFELRRKMRQVAIQVQDIGSYLSWQSYVDDPGRELGVAQLVHIAKPASFDSIPDPELPARLEAFADSSRALTIPFLPVHGGADNRGEVYRDGVEENDEETWGSLEHIQADFPQVVVCDKPKHRLAAVELRPTDAVQLSVHDLVNEQNDGSKASFRVHLDLVSFNGQPQLTVPMVLHWVPNDNANDAIDATIHAIEVARTNAMRAETEKAMVEAVKERTTLVSKIARRPSSDLREEERIVVYRRLVQDMLMAKLNLPDDRTRHLAAEVINSIFDVEKMLYYVAPEWWRPRLHASKQAFSPQDDGKGGAALPLVGWGGTREVSRDNYMITEESEPARLGASLGWLLQLDGDNMRNAFLNAPWVKAVIPIRPGQEQAALEWLSSAEVEGTDGLDAIYEEDDDEATLDGTPYNGLTLREVLEDLAARIKQKHEAAAKVEEYDLGDDNSVLARPVDRVFEYGFNPLQGGFAVPDDDKFPIVDQWVEILPTDQIVPVAVKYDPLTGRMV